MHVWLESVTLRVTKNISSLRLRRTTGTIKTHTHTQHTHHVLSANLPLSAFMWWAQEWRHSGLLLRRWPREKCHPHHTLTNIIFLLLSARSHQGRTIQECVCVFSSVCHIGNTCTNTIPILYSTKVPSEKIKASLWVISSGVMKHHSVIYNFQTLL